MNSKKRINARYAKSGITLIALVITIIVLMILAGVTVSMIMNAGVLDKAQTATERYTLEQIKEEIENEISLAQAQSYETNNRGLTLEELGEYFKQKGYKNNISGNTQVSSRVQVTSRTSVTSKYLYLEYKGYTATINEKLQVTNIELTKYDNTIDITYTLERTTDGKISALVKIDSTDAMKNVQLPNGENLIIENKNKIAVDYEVEIGNSYEFNITKVDGTQVKKVLEIKKLSPVLYLYKYGDLCEDYTSGWEYEGGRYYPQSSYAKLEDGYMDLYYGGYRATYLKNIDIIQYKYINIEVECTGYRNSWTKLACVFYDELGEYTNENGWGTNCNSEAVFWEHNYYEEIPRKVYSASIENVKNSTRAIVLGACEGRDYKVYSIFLSETEFGL